MRIRWKQLDKNTMVAKVKGDHIQIQTFATHHTIHITRKDGSSSFTGQPGPQTLEDLQRHVKRMQRVYYEVMHSQRPDLYGGS